MGILYSILKIKAENENKAYADKIINDNKRVYVIADKIAKRALSDIEKLKDKMPEHVYLDVCSIINQVESDIIKSI